jgi:hypothetical protein
MEAAHMAPSSQTVVVKGAQVTFEGKAEAIAVRCDSLQGRRVRRGHELRVLPKRTFMGSISYS